MMQVELKFAIKNQCKGKQRTRGMTCILKKNFVKKRIKKNKYPVIMLKRNRGMTYILEKHFAKKRIKRSKHSVIMLTE